MDFLVILIDKHQHINNKNNNNNNNNNWSLNHNESLLIRVVNFHQHFQQQLKENWFSHSLKSKNLFVNRFFSNFICCSYSENLQNTIK